MILGIIAIIIKISKKIKEIERGILKLTNIFVNLIFLINALLNVVFKFFKYFKKLIKNITCIRILYKNKK